MSHYALKKSIYVLLVQKDNFPHLQSTVIFMNIIAKSQQYIIAKHDASNWESAHNRPNHLTSFSCLIWLKRSLVGGCCQLSVWEEIRRMFGLVSSFWFILQDLNTFVWIFSILKEKLLFHFTTLTVFPATIESNLHHHHYPLFFVTTQSSLV